MRISLILAAMVFLVACEPSNEERIAAIYEELEAAEISEYVDVSIGSVGSDPIYIIDTGMLINDYTVGDCMLIYALAAGCAARAIESDDGILRVGYTTIWIDLPMTHAHEMLVMAERGDSDQELFEYLSNHCDIRDR